ncbi:MAG: DUF1211 domain-containing protein [Bradyrhizobium sp.]|uniref:TMEM175 family protein n=1 Tax=Bradyrhizobium sp. TaxID=376 RepID=UPI001D45D5EC|nr:TMEM175 family protein [Bradyrhizobium sp.]MBV9562745.1 DUF1211 domain-containing protein [Bradyrhizobium sp.]
MFSKARLDALSDGIFAVAMTLLVLDLRLPDDFHPRDGAELLEQVAGLWPKFLPYALSFGVLGLRWIANLELRSKAEYVNREYVNWWLLYLLLITCVPFTTILVGRFASLAPTVWLYAGNTLLISLVGVRLVFVTPDLEQGDHLARRQASALLLMLSSVLAIALSFVRPNLALWAFALNFAAPVLRVWFGRHRLPG